MMLFIIINIHETYTAYVLLCIKYSENRYLLFLTENYAALDILEHYLKVGGDPAKSSRLGEESMVSQDEVTSQPFVLFGSSFPKDKEYTQVRIVLDFPTP